MTTRHIGATERSALAAHEAVRGMTLWFRDPSAKARNIAGHYVLIHELAQVVEEAGVAAQPFGYVLRARGEDNGAFGQFTSAARSFRKSSVLVDAAGTTIRNFVSGLRRDGSPLAYDYAARRCALGSSIAQANESLNILGRTLSTEGQSHRSDAEGIQQAISYFYKVACNLDESLLLEAHLVQSAYAEAEAERQAGDAFGSLTSAAHAARSAMCRIRTVKETREENARTAARRRS